MDQLIIPKFIFFFFSPHLSASYCIEIVRRNSVTVTPGSKRVKEDLKSNTLEGNLGGGRVTYWKTDIVNEISMFSVLRKRSVLENFLFNIKNGVNFKLTNSNKLITI